MVSCLSCLWAHRCTLLRCLHNVQVICSGPQCFCGSQDECSCVDGLHAPLQGQHIFVTASGVTCLLGVRLQERAAMQSHFAASAMLESSQAMAASDGDHALHPHLVALYLGSLGKTCLQNLAAGQDQLCTPKSAQQGDVQGNGLTWRRGAGNALASWACHCPLWTVAKHPRGHHGACSAPWRRKLAVVI